MSIELVCINYGNVFDALKTILHCVKLFPRFERVTIFHPDPTIRALSFGDIPLTIVESKSLTQNECCMYEMPGYVECDHVMGVQWDGFIVNPDAWTDEFLEYDYIAPPWPLTNIVNPKWRVGSGGFLLASRKMVKLWPTLCAPHPFPNDWSTGAVHRDRFEAAGMKFAPIELAARFGEEIPLEDYPKVPHFGFHGFQYGDHAKYKKMLYGE